MKKLHLLYIFELVYILLNKNVLDNFMDGVDGTRKVVRGLGWGVAPKSLRNTVLEDGRRMFCKTANLAVQSRERQVRRHILKTAVGVEQ
jgi:hypothetical protein